MFGNLTPTALDALPLSRRLVTRAKHTEFVIAMSVN